MNNIKKDVLNGNENDWFNRNSKIVFVMSLVIMFFSSIVSAFAVSSYLYNSNEVSFNNASSTSISSSNVQGAIDELYADAHNYSEMNTRVSTLESRWSATTNRVLDIGKDTTTTGSRGVRIFDANGKDRSYIVFNSNTTQIVANGASGSDSAGWAKGTIDLQGNPVKVNGIAIGDLIKLKKVNVKCTSLSQNYNLSSLITLDSGYKFLGWQSMGTSNGWVSSFPIYISDPQSTRGGVFWSGTLNTTSAATVDFYYFEIKS